MVSEDGTRQHSNKECAKCRYSFTEGGNFHYCQYILVEGHKRPAVKEHGKRCECFELNGKRRRNQSKPTPPVSEEGGEVVAKKRAGKEELEKRMELYNQGLNDYQIAAECGVDHSVITKWRYKHHLESNRNWNKWKKEANQMDDENVIVTTDEEGNPRVEKTSPPIPETEDKDKLIEKLWAEIDGLEKKLKETEDRLHMFEVALTEANVKLQKAEANDELEDAKVRLAQAEKLLEEKTYQCMQLMEQLDNANENNGSYNEYVVRLENQNEDLTKTIVWFAGKLRDAG